MLFICQYCKKIKTLCPSIAKRRKFCSLQCKYDAGQTEETKDKLKRAALEQFKDGMPEETKKKIKKTLTGKYTGIESSMYGKENKWGHHTEEAKEKNRRSHVGKRMGSKSKSWKGNNIGIRSKHCRIINMKGKAKEHKCIDCDRQAHDWSNIDHKYSLNPDDYQPRCCSCHRLYDQKFNK